MFYLPRCACIIFTKNCDVVVQSIYSDSLPDLNLKIGPFLYITKEMISKVIAKMKTGKTAGPSGIVIEMIRSADKVIIKLLQTLQTELSRNALFLQIETFCILSIYTRVKVVSSLETIAEV